MDDKIKTTIEKIKLLSEQNEEFKREMQKMFGKTSFANAVSVSTSIANDVTAIRSALEIRANVSISYDFIKVERLRDQLIIDNLRMENAALNLKEPEADRFYTFCVNAFYQIENILNYFYHTSFPDIYCLLDEIESATKIEESFKFNRTGKEQDVSSIPIAHKINAFCNTFIEEDKSLKWAIGTLRQVRNEGEHRCAIIRDKKDEKNNLYKFFQKNTFNSIRIYLKKLALTVKKALEESYRDEYIDVKITSKLPSACYVLMKGKPTSLPIKLLSKVGNRDNGDCLTLIVNRNRIIDIK